MKVANSINKKEQSRIINQILDEEEYSKARKLLLKLVKDNSGDQWSSHWLLTRISTTYYEERAYNKAIEYAEQALKIAPRCPLVLWDYAGALDMLKRDEEAIQVYKKLIKRGAAHIAYGECGEGIRDARSLVNDTHYRLGLLYARENDFRLASKYTKEHIANRSRNCPSIYNLRDVKKDLAMILEDKDPRRD